MRDYDFVYKLIIETCIVYYV